MIDFQIKKRKIRIVDLMPLLLLVSIFIVVALLFLRQGKYVTLVIRITDSGSPIVSPFADSSVSFGDAIQIGMAKYDFFGGKTLEILDKRVYPTGERLRVVDLTLRAKAVYDKRSKQYSYDGSPLLIGSTQKFILNNFLIRGYIREIGGESSGQTSRYKEKGVLNPLFHNPSLYGWSGAGFTGTPNTTGIPIYLSNRIAIGDSILDNKGHTLVTIKDVVKRPGVFTVFGQYVYSIIDPKSMEVHIETEIDIEFVGQPMYLGIYPLLINTSLPLYFPQYTLTLTVESFEEIK